MHILCWIPDLDYLSEPNTKGWYFTAGIRKTEREKEGPLLQILVLPLGMICMYIFVYLLPFNTFLWVYIRWRVSAIVLPLSCRNLCQFFHWGRGHVPAISRPFSVLLPQKLLKTGHLWVHNLCWFPFVFFLVQAGYLQYILKMYLYLLLTCVCKVAESVRSMLWDKTEIWRTALYGNAWSCENKTASGSWQHYVHYSESEKICRAFLDL